MPQRPQALAQVTLSTGSIPLHNSTAARRVDAEPSDVPGQGPRLLPQALPARINPGDVTAHALGLRIAKGIDYAIWHAIGEKLAARANTTVWWLGDWLAFGQQSFERYPEAVAATGLRYQTLRNYASVARRYSLERRRANLTFQHHAEVASLSDADQDRWLDRAADEGWSAHELRRHLQETKHAPRPQATSEMRLVVGAEQQQQWESAAAASGLTLQEWIVTTLDTACCR